MKSVKTKTLIFIFIYSFLTILLGAVLKIFQYEVSKYILIIGLFSNFLLWLYFLYEIIILKINNKSVWLLSMFFFPILPMITYLIKRNYFLKS